MFNWPTYGSRQRVEIGENTTAGSGAFAVRFWRGSDVHRRTVTNATYREVSIAALPSSLRPIVLSGAAVF